LVLSYYGAISAGSGNTSTDMVGKLTFTSATFGTSGAGGNLVTYDWKYSSASPNQFSDAGVRWDDLAVTGLSVSTTVDVVPIAITGAANFAAGTDYKFDIMTGVGANAATLATQFQLDTTLASFASSVGADNSSNNFSIEGDPANGGEIYIQYTAAPEPTSVTLLGLGVASLFLRRRRRNASSIS
jgi:hypothetical protein